MANHDVEASGRECAIMLRGRSWWQTMRKVRQGLGKVLGEFLAVSNAGSALQETSKMRRLVLVHPMGAVLQR
jgi:hypothetical protein